MQEDAKILVQPFVVASKEYIYKIYRDLRFVDLTMYAKSRRNIDTVGPLFEGLKY